MTTFNDTYEIQSVIGKGGMSTVYLARHKRLHTRWAVKQNGKWGYADLTGQIVIPCQFASARRFSEGIAFVRYSEGDQAWSIINTRGEDITGDIQATETSTNEEGFYLIEEEEGWRHIYCGS